MHKTRSGIYIPSLKLLSPRIEKPASKHSRKTTAYLKCNTLLTSPGSMPAIRHWKKIYIHKIFELVKCCGKFGNNKYKWIPVKTEIQWLKHEHQRFCNQFDLNQEHQPASHFLFLCLWSHWNEQKNINVDFWSQIDYFPSLNPIQTKYPCKKNTNNQFEFE